MPFCPNCGESLTDRANFCPNCGLQVKGGSSESNGKRKVVYEGKLHKCPNCGELLESLVTECPSCGYEIRNAKSSDSVQEFAVKLSEADSVEERIVLIRNYPIPNTKEDIFEYMILASTNIMEEDHNDVRDAWCVKFEQGYQKATLLFGDDEDFFRIKKIYENGKKGIKFKDNNVTAKGILLIIARNVAVVAGLALLIAAVITDRSGGNGSMMELLSYIILIASACSLSKRNAALVDFVVGVASGLLALAISSFLNNSSMGELCGGIIIIAAVVSYLLRVGKNRNT